MNGIDMNGIDNLDEALNTDVNAAIKRCDYVEAGKIKTDLEKRKAERRCGKRGSISEYTQFDKLKEIVERGMCSRTGWADARAGDCEYVIGLPGKSIPNPKHDGPDTEDIYGKPNGWCWQCWKNHQLDNCRKEIGSLRVRNHRLNREVQALEAWQIVAAESNRDVSTYLQERFPSLELEGGMPIHNIRKVLDSPIPRKTTLTEQAFEKLSGDLSHSNVAEAKEILKKILNYRK